MEKRQPEEQAQGRHNDHLAAPGPAPSRRPAVAAARPRWADGLGAQAVHLVTGSAGLSSPG